MIERKPGYYGGFYDPNNKCFVDGDICLESDLREVEAERDKYKEQRDRLLSLHFKDCFEIENFIKKAKTGNDVTSWMAIKLRERITELEQITGLSWEELKRKVEA